MGKGDWRMRGGFTGSTDAVLRMLDTLVANRGSAWWDGFWALLATKEGAAR